MNNQISTSGLMSVVQDVFGQAGGGGVFDALTSLVSAWEVAEEAIEEMQREYPLYFNTIFDCFQYLMPSQHLHQFDGQYFYGIYKSHCREIIKRVIDGEPLEWATKAELLALWRHSTWLGTPLQRRAARAYWVCFKDAMPAEIVDKIAGRDDVKSIAKDLTFGSEEYPGATDEILGELAKKLATDRGGKPRKNIPARPQGQIRLL